MSWERKIAANFSELKGEENSLATLQKATLSLLFYTVNEECGREYTVKIVWKFPREYKAWHKLS